MGQQPATVAAACFALCLVPRLGFVILAPAYGGDAVLYELVAQNILQNGCVSVADPVGGICTPHWGGNQLPGYPLFIAAAWAASGGAKLAPLVGQAMMYSVAAAYAAWAAARFYGIRAAVAVAIVLAFSPVLVAWPRMELTETLALAASVWVLAAVIRSLDEKRVRWLEFGVVFALGVFIRYDFALLAVPVTVAGLAIARPATVIHAAALAALVVAVPTATWWARSVAAGLPPIPPIGLTASGDPAPSGTLHWMGTWVRTQYDLSVSVWPLVTGDYPNIRVPEPVRTVEAEALLQTLTSLPIHTPVPSALDREFEGLASAWREEHPWRRWLGLPLERAALLWGSPFPSMGWPAEVGSAVRSSFVEAYEFGGVAGAFRVALANAPAAAAKATVALWRALVLACLMAVLATAALLRRPIPILLTAAILFAAVRTAVFSETVLVETRYLSPAMAWIEVSLALALVGWRKRPHNRSTPHHNPRHG